MKHVISAIVENQPGVLAHVSSMFAARGFNIDSLVVGRTDDPAYSRMTIVVIGDDHILEQVRKQLEKLIAKFQDKRAELKRQQQDLRAMLKELSDAEENCQLALEDLGS